MDDSDDYFGDDDLILDDETAAALEESERIHASQPRPLPPPPPVQAHARPPAKRQRTETGWAPGFGTRADSLNDIDLPEITVHGNGYAISNTSGTSGPSAHHVPQAAPNRPAQNVQHQQRPVMQRVNSVQNNRVPTPSQAPPTSQYQRGVQHAPPIRKSVTTYQPPPTRPPAAHARTVRNYTPARNIPSPANAPPRYPPAPGPDPRAEEIRQLQEMMEKLRQSNEKMQIQLTEALEAKMARDGEVIVLRKNIEKNAASHSAELAKLKAAKEEVDAKILRTQQAKQEELEQLRTQFKFKQQELEAVYRKPPGSVRPKRVSVGPPATPLAGPAFRVPSSSQRVFNADLQKTPSKPSSATWGHASLVPKLPSPRKALFRSPEKPKKAVLPGFQNAFATTSTPLFSSSQQRKKDKGKAVESSNFADQISQPPPTIRLLPDSFPEVIRPESRYPSPVVSSPNKPEAKNDNIFITPLDKDGDVDMDLDGGSGETSLEPEDVEDQYQLEPTNWKAELSRIMLTHVRPGCDHLTLQILLAANIELDDDPDAPSRYMRAYSSMINALSYSTRMEDYEQTLETICSACLVMGQLLSSCKMVGPLTSLFNLLAIVTFYIPQFRTCLYRQAASNHSNSCDILDLVSTILTSHVAPSNKTDPDKEALGLEVLEFLEALCFESEDHEILRFTTLVRSDAPVATLLNPSNTLVLLEKATRVLALLSTHADILYRALLSLPDPLQDGGEAVQPKADIVGRMCIFVFKQEHEGHESQALRQHILTFFTQLSLAHLDAHTALTASAVVLPSLVYHLHRITSPIFDYEEGAGLSDNVALSLVDYVSQCTRLISHLTFTGPGISLRHKLQSADQRHFGSVSQMFVVTFSQLSWAAHLSDWLCLDARNILVRVSEVAEPLFSAVVEGPDNDAAWNLYNDEFLPLPEEGVFDVDNEDPEQMETELT